MQHLYQKGHYNAIFLQPTTACAWSCEGCYLKKYERVHENVGHKSVVPPWMDKIASRLLKGNPYIACNQLSISLNNLPVHEPGSGNFGMGRFIRSLPNRPYLPELHFTISCNAVDGYKIHDLWDQIASSADSITLSIDEYKNKFKPLAQRGSLVDGRWYNGPLDRTGIRHLNANLMFTPDLIKLIHQYPDFITDLISVNSFDSVYLLAHKPDLGENYSIKQVELIRFMINTYNALPNTLKEKKVFLDSCVTTCAKSKHGCSAAINMMTLWPDGGVTGCPYSSQIIQEWVHNKDQDPDYVVDSMLKELQNVREIGRNPNAYEFNQCKMRDLWNRK